MARILVIDDEVTIREIVRNALSAKGYEVASVPSAEHAREIVFREPFDLVLLDINLAGETGISVLQKIRETQKKIPIVIYSGELTPEGEMEARSAGANEVLRKDIGIPQLVAQIEKILKAKDRIFEASSGDREKTILIVDDEKSVRSLLTDFFSRKRYKILEAESGEAALALARVEKISLVLLDINMEGMDGIETLEKLLQINPKLGVVMVTGNQEDENIKKAVALGAYGYVLKPFDFLYLDLVVMARLAIAAQE